MPRCRISKSRVTIVPTHGGHQQITVVGYLGVDVESVVSIGSGVLLGLVAPVISSFYEIGRL